MDEKVEEGWLDCEKEDIMYFKGVDSKLIADRNEWKKNKFCADPTKKMWEKGRKITMKLN